MCLLNFVLTWFTNLILVSYEIYGKKYIFYVFYDILDASRIAESVGQLINAPINVLRHTYIDSVVAGSNPNIA